MTAQEPLEVETLSASERAELDELMRDVEKARKLSPEELGDLAQKLVEATDPQEVFALKKALFAGFYGTSDA